MPQSRSPFSVDQIYWRSTLEPLAFEVDANERRATRLVGLVLAVACAVWTVTSLLHVWTPDVRGNEGFSGTASSKSREIDLQVDVTNNGVLPVTLGDASVIGLDMLNVTATTTLSLPGRKADQLHVAMRVSSCVGVPSQDDLELADPSDHDATALVAQATSWNGTVQVPLLTQGQLLELASQACGR